MAKIKATPRPEIKGKTAREIVTYVNEVTGITIALSLKNKQGIINKANYLLDTHEQHLRTSSNTGDFKETYDTQNTMDEVPMNPAVDEDKSVSESVGDGQVEMNVLDVRLLSKQDILQKTHRQRSISMVGWIIATLFYSRARCARVLLEEVNRNIEYGYEYDDVLW